MNTKTFEWNDELVSEYSRIMVIESCMYSKIRTSLKEFKESKQPKPLFISEDGIEIFDVNQEVWDTCTQNWNFLDSTPAMYMVQVLKNNPDRKAWCSKERAEEYILMNKPALSINNVKKAFDTRIYAHFLPLSLLDDTIHELKEKIKNGIHNQNT
jgi:hypothetical protein